ncbi:acyl-CoA dehydrogenase family protein [Nocardia sp. NPDC049149]|uniref:acyl-CoA dehydrogenase family protein n=1 Tax=Nocardia sp. NPDC049149 TaxID=3364315 RepID=UPI003713256A
MTTSDVTANETYAEPPLRPFETAATTTTVEALREVIFGAHTSLHTQVRDLVVGLSDLPPSGLTFARETEIAPALLRAVIAGLGRPASEIAADAHLRGALCDWAQVAAPRLLLVLTGHFDLTVGAILALGNGSRYQQDCLAELDTGAALGVLMLTELGGTNGADQQTIARWDTAAGEFRLSTPAASAVKIMPNVADARVPKTAVVTARLLVDGRDEGVLPFLLRLRTRHGLADGVHVVRLPDKDSAPMDHAMIRFDDVRLPRAALLGGDWAQMSTDGRFDCTLPPRKRFHRAISVLGNGRLDLANAAIASARAALAGLVNYTRQRRPGAGMLMADRDAVQRDLVTGLAAVYAASGLGLRLRDLRATTTGSGQEHAVWSMLAKPLLSNTAHQVLMMCRQRAAAQGALRVNHIVDWVGNLEAIITAEGENQIMQITAGKQGRDLTALRLPDTPRMPWYIDTLAERERTIAADLHNGSYHSAGHALGPDSAAIELATATAERLAATALATAALNTSDPTAKELIGAAAGAYALERIHARGTWYTAHRRMSPDLATWVTTELNRLHGVLSAHLPIMVAAFDIPDLPGPIFATDYIRAWQDYAGWDDEIFTAVDSR